MSEPIPTPEQLSRFFAGVSPPAEEESVRHWLAQRTDRRVDVEAALLKVKQRSAPVSPFQPRFVMAAAAALLLIGGALITRRASPPEPVRHATAVGARDTVRFDDGSRVILGPASSLLVTGARNVALHGEAFFEIVHDERRPFVVRAGNTTIRDVGTAFSVASDSGGEAAVRVVVTEGVVEVRHGRDVALLQRGDVARVDASGAIETRRGRAAAEDLAWLTGGLAFRDAPVAEIAADLRRWYGVELRVTDSTLLQRRFTGVFVGDSIDRVLEVLALALGARVTRDGDVAHLTPGPSRR